MSDPTTSDPTTRTTRTTPPTPKIFKTPSTKPEICFHVFVQQYHVSSAALKLNSGFFRTFLQPSGGVMPTFTLAGFSSEWFTKVDEGGEGWALSSCHVFRDEDLSKFKGGGKHEVKVFEMLLCAIYSRPYILSTISELSTLTEMVYFYQALPIVSSSLYFALFKKPSQEFSDELMVFPELVLGCAKKLRQEDLYNDAMILSIGPWTTPLFKSYQDPELKQLASIAHGKMDVKVEKVQRKIMAIIGNFMASGDLSNWSHPTLQMAGVAATCVKVNEVEQPKLCLPKYYNECSKLESAPQQLSDDIMEAFIVERRSGRITFFACIWKKRIIHGIGMRLSGIAKLGKILSPTYKPFALDAFFLWGSEATALVFSCRV